MSKDGTEIRRRRVCETCERRFTTYERVFESMPVVIKTDGRREAFDRQKILRGLKRACAKRPVALSALEELAMDIERETGELDKREVPSREIGERVLPRLRAIDEVAYVRFASIYRSFRDVDEFMTELSDVVKQREKGE